MCADGWNNSRNMGAVPEPEGSDDYGIDEFLDILPGLVSATADLSRHRHNSLYQTFEDTQTIKEPFPALYITSTGNTSAGAGPLKTQK